MNPVRITLDVWPDGRVEVVKDDRGSLPPIVKLSKSDPDFENKLRELKSQGYKWNNRSKDWRLPKSKAPRKTSFDNWWGDLKEVKLLKTEADFEAKKDALKVAGATYDGIDNVWVLPQ